jgi:hypothetical protein
MSYGTGEPYDVRRLAEDLTARVLADQASIAQRYQSLLERVGAGEIDPIRLRAEYDALLREHSAQMVNELNSIGAEYYRAVLEIHRRYVDQLLDQLGAARPGTDASGDTDGAESPVAARGEISMSGRLGEDVTASFVVENPDDDDGQVRFFVSPVVAADGSECGPIEVQPTQLALAPGASAEVVARVFLDPERFGVGGQYEGGILARGTRDFEVTVHILVEPPVGDPG